MITIALVSVINHYQINELHLFFEKPCIITKTTQLLTKELYDIKYEDENT